MPLVARCGLPRGYVGSLSALVGPPRPSCGHGWTRDDPGVALAARDGPGAAGGPEIGGVRDSIASRLERVGVRDIDAVEQRTTFDSRIRTFKNGQSDTHLSLF